MIKFITLILNKWTNHRRLVPVALTYDRKFARRQWRQALGFNRSAWRNHRQAGRSGGFQVWLGNQPAYNEPKS